MLPGRRLRCGVPAHEGAGYDFLGDDYTFIAGEVRPDEALGTQVAYFNDPDGTNLEIIHPKGGFAN
ncbi:hypothetical protein STRCI_000951 [Streptomyces cinnabarinus]|uniref:VOC domain-containing protein n=1 Tax=Streptomyces cinnabarinus TaxID=67287 RepID=A0ABY7K667_9ACTN|nr:hypothetical protein [Streptomyces cinnabarinus]WAZ19869.1 hypothetical protein STRCI_000951 [Streptomyces cinnabarinus]